jgi:capsular polysaccharide export protein
MLKGPTVPLSGSVIEFWCPPLNRRCKQLAVPVALTEPSLPDTNIQAMQPVMAGQPCPAQNILDNWPLWQVSRFNRYRDAVAIKPGYILVILQQQSAAGHLTLLQHAEQAAKKQGCYLLVISDTDGGMVSDQAFSLSGFAAMKQATRLGKPAHHATLLRDAHAVYTETSWLGFEALLWRRPVYCFGDAFFHLPGLTENAPGADTVPPVTLTQLLDKVFCQQLRWINPDNNQTWPAPVALEWLALQRRQRQAFPQKLYAIGFRRYWRSTVQLFFQGCELHFVSSAAKVPSGSTAILWGNRSITLKDNVQLIRLEDGFMRSVGLGALFVRPLSWVADSYGMYFDARQSSALELMLSQHQFSQKLLNRASALITRLSQTGVSKYNTGSAGWRRPLSQKKCILVPGQVESDASIAYGAPGIKRNIDLLKAVRTANSDAYIIYKPHPDVVAGARLAGQNEDSALNYCDELLLDTDINIVLQQVDEVHVLTSLAGFEALIRGKKVVCYGMPFYTGWGLTEDKQYCQRRKRTLNIEELVAATLICYPIYVSRHSGYYHSAEQTLEDLMLWRQQVKKPHWLKQWLIRGIRKIVGIK